MKQPFIDFVKAAVEQYNDRLITEKELANTLGNAVMGWDSRCEAPKDDDDMGDL